MRILVAVLGILAAAFPGGAAPKESRPKIVAEIEAPLRWTFTPRTLAEEVVELFPRYRVPPPPSVGAGRDVVFYASPRDHRVLCLDQKTGKLQWEFTTGAPVREAPRYFEGNVYFGSDDGCRRCGPFQQYFFFGSRHCLCGRVPMGTTTYPHLPDHRYCRVALFIPAAA